MMMQDSKLTPIDEKYRSPDYVNDIYPFEIRFAFNSFAPYVNRNLFSDRFAENVFRSETGAGDIIYYPNQIEDSILMSLYRKKELYALIDAEIVCIKNDSLIYPFMALFQQGFTKGYFELKNNLEIENKEKIVFNIAINESLSGLDTAYEVHNFNGHNIKLLSDELIFESGVKTGRNYRAWQVILDKPHLYIQLFRESENLVSFYRWNLDYETKRQDQRDSWGRKKGLEVLLTHDIDSKLLEKVEQKMLNYGSLEPAVASVENVKEIKDILKANDKHRDIINMYDDLFRIHKDQKLVLAKMGRSKDLNVGTETSSDKNRTDMITKILRGYGRIK